MERSQRRGVRIHLELPVGLPPVLADPDQLRQEEQRLIVAIAQNPKDADLYSSLARVYMRLQNYTDAVEALEAAHKLVPDDESIASRLERARKRKEKADQEATAAVAAGQ